ncbi:MAG: hypothetical protein AVDCRST_MAG89-5151 [uncultured Gemmatimonadetes bacterium]|uniref:DUF4365 domain-containing protein n=1 Tax=uncultured Gemmatimonadota bacterium TaxID=203437 RepID=A0A6J4N8A6_9BACT|nr:MAG: hypothetical protein AVDCRST_MAG89-5151 [uncultured Gemmatimonadota bacterium]
MFEERAVLELKGVKIPESLTPYIDAVAAYALVHVAGLTQFENRRRGRYKLAVATEDGLFVRVGVAGYSSRLAGIERVDSIPELRWPVPVDVVRHARASMTPVLLFLIDTDTRHGRFARLDTLPGPAPGAKSVLVGFTRANMLDPANLERLFAELGTRHQQPAESSAA